MRAELPSEEQVRAAMTQLLEEAAAGKARPNVTALAERAGVSRPGLSRHYRALVDEFLQAATTTPGATQPRRRDPTQELQDQLARLRRRCEDQERHLKLYEEVIRQLTLDNEALRRQLAGQAGVTDLTTRRHRDDDGGS